MAMRRTFMGVDPSAQYDPQQALSTLTGYGIPIAPGNQYFDQAKTIAGWSGSGPVSGAGLNRVLETAAPQMGALFSPWGTGGVDPGPEVTSASLPLPPPPIDPGGVGIGIPGPPPTATPGGAVQRGGSFYLPTAATTLTGMLPPGYQITPAQWNQLGQAFPDWQNRTDWLQSDVDRALQILGLPGGGGGAVPPGGGGTTPPPPPTAGPVPPRAGHPGIIPPSDPGPVRGSLVPGFEDDLSTTVTGGLIDLARFGNTPYGEDIGNTLRNLIASGGRLPGGDDKSKLGFERARNMLEKGRRAQMAQTEAELANRGLLSEPGTPQGLHGDALMRMSENLNVDFANALRDVMLDENQSEDDRFMAAMQLATGMSSDQARVQLAALGEGTQRQTALAQIALQSLAQNQAWAQFLAEYGLKREQVMYDMEQGKVAPYMQLINAFLQLASLSRGGYIGA